MLHTRHKQGRPPTCNTLRVMQVNNQSRTQHGALSLLPQQTNNNWSHP